MSSVKVTVGIAVYNVEDHIEKCLLSILNQTFPLDDLEIICVDDGSTDQSGAILDRYAGEYRQIKVIHQENSGGPGMPRNRVIEEANGEFVFFVDSDDFLGSEAIERMYGMAKKNRTDVVLGKMKGVNGRNVPKSMFKENQPRTDIYQSNIINTLAPMRMIKTKLIRKHHLSFPQVKTGEDQPFMMSVYLLAKGVSVVSDYDCYFLVKHEGDHASAASVDPEEYYGTMSMVMDAIEQYAPSRRKKDQVLLKFFKRHLYHSRSKSFANGNWPYEERAEWFQHLRQFLNRYLPDRIENQLPFYLRLRTFLIKNKDYDTYEAYFHEEKKADYVVEGDQVFARFQSLQDADVPKDLLNYTSFHKVQHHLEDLLWDGSVLRAEGRFFHEHLPNEEQQLSVVFKNRDTNEELTRAIQTFDLDSKKAGKLPDNARLNTGFYIEWDAATFLEANKSKGPWDLYIESRIGDLVKRARIGSKRSNQISVHFKASRVTADGQSFPVRPYYTKDYSNLTMDVGGTRKPVGFIEKVKVAHPRQKTIQVQGAYCLDFITPVSGEPDFSLELKSSKASLRVPMLTRRRAVESNEWDFQTEIALGKRLAKKIEKNPNFQLKIMLDCGEWQEETVKQVRMT